ncbi:MAG: glycosyltransferase family 2 protein [Desulfobulbus sp.]|nr:glycosyltransferase family 2 protein [Desulfobulbus sp.]
MLSVLFFLSVLLVGYVYAGYPLLVQLVGTLRSRPVAKAPFEPMVTVIIPAYNEERHIGKTIANKLALNYPREKMEILVVSDGSTDRTDSIVREFADEGVRLLRQETRGGKTLGLNAAVREAVGEIIFFSDANSLHHPDALQKLVVNFADPQVGYVTGKMIYTNPDGSIIGDGCSAYMKYENAIRLRETNIGSIVGVDGGVDAVRRSLYRPMEADQLPDFVLPLSVADQGYRVVYEPEALLCEDALSTATDEYRMRVRVSLRALWALYDMRRLFLPGKDLMYSWQLWSHKILRYLSFVFLIVALLTNLALLEKGPFFALTLIGQAVFYCGAVLSPILERSGKGNRLLYLAYYFTIINMAAGHAFIKFILGKKIVVWSPRKG